MFLHGVAFLSRNQHPEPNGSRRATPLLHFQHSSGHPRDQSVTPKKNALQSSDEAGSEIETPLIRWSMQEIRRIATRLARKRIRPEFIIAWSLGDEHIRQKQSALISKCNCNAKHTSKNVRFAPFILKADIAQCFPSIYTHSIAWAAHGIEQSKNDTDRASTSNYFNALDFFVRNGQRGNTRAVLVGPDAYRLIAEFVLAKIDQELNSLVGNRIVGAARHVDDYYIGLRNEHDAQAVLSTLREILANYELNLNDQKTKIYSSLEPINDLWAQRLRDHMPRFAPTEGIERFERTISEAVTAATLITSDSPIKILFRSFDEARIYRSINWEYVEQNAQRIIQKHPHAIDYACLLVTKRKALGEKIDSDGWLTVAEMIVKRSLAFNHDHEVLWMTWLLLACDIEIPTAMVDELSKSRNAHIRALLVQAYVEGKLKTKPRLALGGSLSSVDANWLVNLVARSQNFSKAAFSGLLSDEFDHLAKKHIRLLDFNEHPKRVRKQNTRAISRTRYGYDDIEDEDFEDLLSDNENDDI